MPSWLRRRPRREPGPKKNLPPFPTRQMFVLACCRISEPIAFMSIFPYIYKMVEGFNFTQDKSTISLYAGMVTSAFTLAEFATGFFWGKISDKFGRKPVLLMGLAGTALSVVIFGFAPNIQVALFARALGGLLNGNIGVLSTTVAELVTVKEHQGRAYTVMPLVWSLGSIVGPTIGGALAQPVKRYPTWFAEGTIFEKFPYLLPNLFSAACVVFGLVVGFLFLEETHAEKKKHRDIGLEIGNHLLARVWWTKSDSPAKGEQQPLLQSSSEDQLPGYRTTDNSPQLACTPGPALRESFDLERALPQAVTQQRRQTKVFNRDVILNIVSYGILAFHTMTFDSLFPTFLSTPSPENAGQVSLPFKFTGGFGFDESVIGGVISFQGIFSLASTGFLFPFAQRRLGPLQLFRTLAASYWILYFATPYLVLLPGPLQRAGIYFIIMFRCVYMTLAYPSNAILLSNAAPSNLSLGTINGVAASVASLSRAFGPTVSGFLYSIGLRTGYSGLAWWFSALITIVGAVLSFQIRERQGRLDEKKENTEETETDPA